MKTHLKSIVYFLIPLIMFQSCYTYQSYTVDRAVMEEKKVRIVTINGEIYRYKKLIRRDGQLYGLKKVQGRLSERDISHLDIIELNWVTPGRTILVVFASILGVIFLIGAIDIAENGILNTKII